MIDLAGPPGGDVIAEKAVVVKSEADTVAGHRFAPGEPHWDLVMGEEEVHDSVLVGHIAFGQCDVEPQVRAGRVSPTIVTDGCAPSAQANNVHARTATVTSGVRRVWIAAGPIAAHPLLLTHGHIKWIGQRSCDSAARPRPG